MKKFLVSLLIGILAGIIDVIPMIFMNFEWNANLSAFLHWVILGIIINYIDFGIRSWLKGFIVAVLSAIPIVLIVEGGILDTFLPILVMSAILGSFVGHFGSKYGN